MDDSDWAWAAFAYSAKQFDKTDYNRKIDEFHREIELYLNFVSIATHA